MASILAKLESLLFVSSTPLTVTKLAKIFELKPAEIRDELAKLKEKWNTEDSGVLLVQNDDEVQLMSHPDNAELVASFLKDETTGELTRPALETLSIIAYRQPITKPELEQIRGVNCSLILRNLLLRGLIEEKEDPKRMQLVYRATMDFVRLLGLSSMEELPDYQVLREHPHISDVLDGLEENKSAP